MTTKHKLYVAFAIPSELVAFMESNNLEVSLAPNVPVPRDELLKSVGECDAIFCAPSITVDKEMLDLAPNLKVIGTLSVGYNHIDLKECFLRNIKVGYVFGVLDDPVAEFAVTLTLNTIKRISESIEAAKNGEWILGDLYWMCGMSIFESTVGILGLGRIGFQIGERIKSFKPSRILYHDVIRNPNAHSSVYEFVEFDTLLAESDILICMCTLTKETEGLFNMNVFRKMKRSAVFINCSRGGVVNQEELAQALKTNTIAAAGLDVTTPEPLPKDNELFKLKNCFITPHIAAGDTKLRTKMFHITVQNILRGLAGQPLISEIKFS